MSYTRLEALINGLFSKRKIHESWRSFWASFFDPALIDVSVDTEISLRRMLWRIDEHLVGRSGHQVPLGALAGMTLHATKGLQFHSVFLCPPEFGERDVEELRRLYFVGLSRAKVKAYLIDWPGCDTSLWNEMSEAGGRWIAAREPRDDATRVSTADDRDLARGFRYFNTRKRGLGTGMRIFHVFDQSAITSLARDQQLEWRLVTRDGRSQLQFLAGGRLVGELKNRAVDELQKSVCGQWARIFRVEVAQVLQTETPGGNHSPTRVAESHYYVVPWVFYGSAD